MCQRFGQIVSWCSELSTDQRKFSTLRPLPSMMLPIRFMPPLFFASLRPGVKNRPEFNKEIPFPSLSSLCSFVARIRNCEQPQKSTKFKKDDHPCLTSGLAHEHRQTRIQEIPILTSRR